MTFITHTPVLLGVTLFPGLIAGLYAWKHCYRTKITFVADNRHSILGRLTMNERHAGTWSIIAALLVLFTAMLDPRIAAALAIFLLVAFALYQFTYKPNPEK